MSRLSQELQRLGLPAAPDTANTDHPAVALPDAAGRAPALVLDLRAPADWSALARVWQGVQADLDLPAPGIAVSGTDGVQLWFALREPVDAGDGAAFLQALVQRWLADVPAHRLRLRPGTPGWQPAAVPALQGEDRDGPRWSAFVAPDLAPMFSDTPWLDVPPNPDGQAALLARLQPLAAGELRRALAAPRPAPASAPAPAPAPVADPAPAPVVGPALPPAAARAPTADGPSPAATPAAPADAPAGAPWTDPCQFLLAVMNDAAVPMALRIEAAKALMPAR